jgi:hypothetical protein
MNTGRTFSNSEETSDDRMDTVTSLSPSVGVASMQSRMDVLPDMMLLIR